MGGEQAGLGQGARDLLTLFAPCRFVLSTTAIVIAVTTAALIITATTTALTITTIAIAIISAAPTTAITSHTRG